MDTDRPVTASQLEAIEDALLRAEELAQCYQNAAMAMSSRACSNASALLAERFEALASDLRQERERAQGAADPGGPPASPHHLFMWHLAEDHDDQTEAVIRAVRDAERRLRRSLNDLRASGPLSNVLQALIDRALATTDDDVDRVGLGRCLGEPEVPASRTDWAVPSTAQSAEGVTGHRRGTAAAHGRM